MSRLSKLNAGEVATAGVYPQLVMAALGEGAVNTPLNLLSL